MKFTVVPSPLDAGFDPVAQYSWNQKLGFISPDYSLLLNQSDQLNIKKQNILVQESMHKLQDTILGLIEDSESNWDNFTSACYIAGNILAKTAIFNSDSSNSIIAVIDALVKLEATSEVEEYHEHIWEKCLDYVITSPACPRPVLWRIVKEISKGQGFNYVTARSTGGLSSGVIYTLCKNPILGDKLISFNEVIGDGNFSCILNPSMTIKSLEKIYPGFLFYAYVADADTLIGKFLREIPTNLINFPTNIKGHPDLTEEFDSGLLVAEYLILASRLLIELKLGRCKIKDLKNSKSSYVRYLGDLLRNPSRELVEEFTFSINKRTWNLVLEMSSA